MCKSMKKMILTLISFMLITLFQVIQIKAYTVVEVLEQYQIFDKSKQTRLQKSYSEAKNAYQEALEEKAYVDTKNKALNVYERKIESDLEYYNNVLNEELSILSGLYSDFEKTLFTATEEELLYLQKEVNGKKETINTLLSNEPSQINYEYMDYTYDLEDAKLDFEEAQRIYVTDVSSEYIGEKLFVPPVSKVEILKSYGKYVLSDGRIRDRNGVVLKARKGEPVRAAFKGQVTSYGFSQDYGNFVVIRVSKDIRVIYTHLDSVSVKQDSSVSQGDVIGYAGNTGRKAVDNQVYFGLYIQGVPVDPKVIMGVHK